jgi:hypothetical protein
MNLLWSDLARVLDGSRDTRREEEMSGATNEVGAPETRIAVPMELVLTPRDGCLKPGTWTRGHRSHQAYSSVFSRQL